jgi:DNA modification methylase
MNELFDSQSTSQKMTGPVTCLGQTFPDDDARRQHFLAILRDKLKDPEFRRIEGFPIGSDEDILALSDPPYYTACPNPFIAEFVKHYGKPCDPSMPYSREPFAADVSVGRYAPESLAHSYHTKVPARAIVRYILHYTKPGDIVLDGFCGTGMTAVAAQLCSGLTFDEKAEIELEVPDAKWGARYPIVADLAPAATFIAANYLHVPEVVDLEERCDRAINEVQQATEWMFTTSVAQSERAQFKARVDHTVWSDVFFCSNCGAELIMWELAVREDGSIDKSSICCPSCNMKLRGSDMNRMMTDSYDALLRCTISRPKSIPVEISYSVDGSRGGRKVPNRADTELIDLINSSQSPYRLPVFKMLFRDGPWGDTYRAGYCAGTTHLHHFYTTRNFYGLAALRHAVLEPSVVWGASMLLTATALKLSRMMRYMSDGIGRIQNGVIYFPSISKETNPTHLLEIAKGQVKKLKREVQLNPREAIVTTCSASDLRGIPESTVDYIFVDPPFGDNIQYSELNFLWEGWLSVFTNNVSEAVVNRSLNKGFGAYAKLMASCFREFHRVLKPGRWMTVEFHNSQNSVWNAIQQAITESGFIIADVRILDKKQGAFNQVVAASAVKKDLVISAYKPNEVLEDRFRLEAGTEDGVWDFVRTHLKQLPVFVSNDGIAETIAERLDYLLFDRMVAFHVQRGVTVPLSATEFYAGLLQRFAERDGMFFLPEQVAEYDKKRITAKEFQQLDLIVTDESSAIQWLRQQLNRKPQTFQELHSQFMREIGGWHKNEKPLELSELLEQSFLCCDGKDAVPSQIHSYLSTNFKDLRNLEKDDPALKAKAKDRWYVPDPNRAGDLEKLRERSLLKEFWEYLPPGYRPQKTESNQSYLSGLKPETPKALKGKRIKIIRLEAVRVGFKHCWQERDYRTIIEIAQRIPPEVLEEDAKLLMWYDQAVTRSEEA